MPTTEEYKQLIAQLPKSPIDVRLTRIVPFMSFDAGMPRKFLFTSGRPNRCNPQGVNCIYFSETDETAHAEWEDMDTDPDQPILTFHARLKAAHMIDLSSNEVFDALGLSDDDLTGNFRMNPLNIQRLGEAVSLQQDAAAIRYPSRAMSRLGKVGFNLAIFPDALSEPDLFVVYGTHNQIIESWPSSISLT